MPGVNDRSAPLTWTAAPLLPLARVRYGMRDVAWTGDRVGSARGLVAWSRVGSSGTPESGPRCASSASPSRRSAAMIGGHDPSEPIRRTLGIRDPGARAAARTRVRNELVRSCRHAPAEPGVADSVGARTAGRDSAECWNTIGDVGAAADRARDLAARGPRDRSLGRGITGLVWSARDGENAPRREISRQPIPRARTGVDARRDRSRQAEPVWCGAKLARSRAWSMPGERRSPALVGRPRPAAVATLPAFTAMTVEE